MFIGIHENAFTSSLNALSLQLLGASPPDPPAGALPLNPVGTQPPDLHSPVAPTPASATDSKFPPLRIRRFVQI